ncbi:class I SAM-dependent methyltransferase [Aeromonas hydrophila]|uniref:class I SAM-dependent methyltransferase n=1 Tax=Aeromonas hydrophila TaxID=644 RepID=UPI0009BB4F3D|nr:class I SAM-dependent methyltransferase [Aeromonas hydrophila]EHK5437921.1 class I SAM-dependent methyltransferase [Aeromonas hydrophila]MBW3798864.1 methyltransferase domain-containing protein [Aeromonas hydrophila]MBW3801790.1 methyltransferase domain-containing protein [Aeromonas hydrophila]MBW3821532.1 methyltransferase domain-containing protein [Aeromonas hydrophila]MBW3843033.1 methyltransferase domain-containing protein [Aeromonas hydrophila]
MNYFENLYQTMGIASQRRYPNESLIGFMAKNFFVLSQSERSQCHVLELGCGSGANIWMLAREGFDVWGLDSSPRGIELCQQVLNSWHVHAHLDVGDMTVLPYCPEYFDAIVDVVSMQHLTLLQHRAALAEIYRCLKPGGRVFSYHLGKGSSVCQSDSVEWCDEISIADIPTGYPLAGNGLTSFLDVSIVHDLYENFKNLEIEMIRRNYSSSNEVVEYIVISAKK